MNKGVEFFLKSIGVSITPEELEVAFEQGKNALPKIAQAYDQMNARMAQLEAGMQLLLSRSSGEVQPDLKHESELSSVSATALQKAIVNGAPELVTRNG